MGAKKLSCCICHGPIDLPEEHKWISPGEDIALCQAHTEWLINHIKRSCKQVSRIIRGTAKSKRGAKWLELRIINEVMLSIAENNK